MNILKRFNRLTTWNKIAAIGALASIIGTVATFAVFYLDNGISGEKARPTSPPSSSTKGAQSPIIRHEGDGDISVNISSSRPSESPSQVEIHIIKHYRTLFQFSLVNQGSTHWAVKRLYLKYVSEYDWDMGPFIQEASMFRINYGIALSREYSEYDLLPLTPDQEIYGFEYRGQDSDHFAVQLYGTDVSIIRICAETYNFHNKKHRTIESDDIRVVSSPTRIPKWDTPLEVTQRSLLDDLKPLSYKTLTSLHFDGFLRNLQPFQLHDIQSDLHKFLTLMQTRKKSGENKLKDIEELESLRVAYFAAGNALIARAERIQKEIDKIQQGIERTTAPNKRIFQFKKKTFNDLSVCF